MACEKTARLEHDKPGICSQIYNLAPDNQPTADLQTTAVHSALATEHTESVTSEVAALGLTAPPFLGVNLTVHV